MNVLTRPIRYLVLVDERGRPLILRNLSATLLLTIVIAVPFIVLKKANFFSDAGFVERAGAFSSVLTGFYIAALVAVATFAAHLDDMDMPIKVGKVIERGRDGEKDQELSRREYVCALFGYLAFLSLTISVLSILGVVVSSEASTCIKGAPSCVGTLVNVSYLWPRAGAIVFYALLLSSLFVHTLHGLYYLVERIYAQSPTIRPKAPQKERKG